MQLVYITPSILQNCHYVIKVILQNWSDLMPFLVWWNEMWFLLPLCSLVQWNEWGDGMKMQRNCHFIPTFIPFHHTKKGLSSSLLLALFLICYAIWFHLSGISADVRTQAMYQLLDSGFIGLIFSCFSEDAQKVSSN